PDEPCLLTQVHHVLEEALEDRQAVALTDAGQTRVVGQRLMQVIPQVPAQAQTVSSHPDQLPLGADVFEEHHQLELEKDDRVDRGTTPLFISRADQVPNEGQVEFGVK